MLRIGPLDLESNLCLSPLAGYTDLAFRRLVRSLGGVGLATTEVASARALLRGGKRTGGLLKTAPDDRPLAIQIDGPSGESLAEAARFVEGMGCAAIDVNMGCPAPSLTSAGGGAAWMRSPERAAGALAAVVAAVRVPVTVKMRLGWDEGSITAPALARACEEAGAAAIVVHGRTSAQGFGGEVSLEGIAAVVAAVRAIPVIGNGDVTSPKAALRMLERTGAAGVAIGREALTDPWIFARTRAFLDGRPVPAPPSFEERVALVRRHYRLLVEHEGERRGTIRFRWAGVWYGPALGVSREYRRRVSVVRGTADVEHLLDDVFDGKLGARFPRGRSASRMALGEPP